MRYSVGFSDVIPGFFQQPIKRTNLIANLRAAPARRRPPPTKSSSTRSCPTARRYASPPTGPARPRLSCRHPHLPGSRFVTRRRLPSSPRSVRVCPRSTRTYKPPDFPHTRARKLHPHPVIHVLLPRTLATSSARARAPAPSNPYRQLPPTFLLLPYTRRPPPPCASNRPTPSVRVPPPSLYLQSPPRVTP